MREWELKFRLRKGRRSSCDNSGGSFSRADMVVKVKEPQNE